MTSPVSALVDIKERNARLEITCVNQELVASTVHVKIPPLASKLKRNHPGQVSLRIQLRSGQSKDTTPGE